MKKKVKKYVHVALCHWFEQGNRDVLEHEVAIFSTQHKADRQLIDWANNPAKCVMSKHLYKLQIQ